MKIATENRLAHYQVEYQELQEKIRVQTSLLAPLQSQIQQLNSYLQYNNGDRAAMKNYRRLMCEYNSTINSIRRYTMRMQSLAVRMNNENYRVNTPRRYYR